MSQSSLVDALADGAIVVTPNNRLARDVALRFDASRRAQGLVAWNAAQVLPWTLWLDRLWLEALAARAGDGRVLLDAGVARELWYSVVKGEGRKLLNPRGAARHAMDAWMQFHAWRAPNEFRAVPYAKRKIPIAIFIGDKDEYFPLFAVRKTQSALEQAGHPVSVTVLPGHNHPYADVALEVNRSAWEFMKANRL